MHCKEVHLLLAEGASNQFGDLPWTARAEMLMQQWLLSRPEMRDFLQGRRMVPYKEPWMAQVDTMKSLQGWTDIPVTHFRDLGVYGEQILLTIRYGDWIDVNNEDAAKNWARSWRPEIQGYLHAYRAVTGMDLTNADMVDHTMPGHPPAEAAGDAADPMRGGRRTRDRRLRSRSQTVSEDIMSRAFESEASDYEYKPEMGEFGEAEFGEGEEEFGEAEFGEAEAEWEAERGRRRRPPPPYGSATIGSGNDVPSARPYQWSGRSRSWSRPSTARSQRWATRPRTWSRPYSAAQRYRWQARPRTWSRPGTAAQRLQRAARPGYWSRSSAAQQPYRWQARALAFLPAVPGSLYYGLGQRPFYTGFTPQWGSPRWGYRDRWGRWRRRYPYGRSGSGASAYAEPEPPSMEPPGRGAAVRRARGGRAAAHDAATAAGNDSGNDDCSR